MTTDVWVGPTRNSAVSIYDLGVEEKIMLAPRCVPCTLAASSARASVGVTATVAACRPAPGLLAQQ